MPFREAVITAVVSLVTADGADTVKLVAEEPALIVTGEETAADPELLDTVTLIAFSAFPLRLTVQVELPGAVKLAGAHVKFDRTGTGGNSVSEAVLETPFNVAVIVAVVLLVTAVVDTVKVPVEEFAATVAGEVTVAEPLLLDTVTLVADAALPLSVIVQVEPVGGVTLVGLQDRLVSVGVGGNNVTVAVLETPLNVAVIVAVVLLVTAVVDTLKVPVEEFAATVAGELTVAEPLLLDTVTLVADGALPLRVIVQVEPVGGVTLVGLQDRLVSVGADGNSVTVEVLETPFNVAVIVAVVLLVTAVVDTLKVPVEEFAATVAGELIVAEPLLLDTVTLVADGALPLSVIVQVEPVGGVTLVGLQDRLVSVGVGGNNVTVAVLETPLNVAVIVAVVLLVTAVVDTLKVPVEEFAATVAGELTVAEPLLLETVTLVADGALPLKVIVQVDPVGGVRLVGLQDRLVSVGADGNSVTVEVLETPFNVAVMVAVVLLVTPVVDTVKVVVEAFALTVAGEVTVAEPLLLDTVTFVAVGVLPARVIVQVELAGGVTLVGLHVRFVSAGTGGNRVTVAVLETPFKVAVIVAVVLLVTAVVDTVKVVVEEFAGTVAGEVTVAEPLLLDTVTFVADAALPLRVIVQVEPVGGVTVVGLQLTPESTTDGVRVNPNVLETPFNVAVMVAVVLLVTEVVDTVKVVVDALALTTAGEVTVADPLLLDTVTFVADGALPLKVIVQVELVGGVTLAGLQDRLVSVGTGGNSVTVAVLEAPFNVAVIVAVVLLVTAVVDTVKVPVEEFAATVAGEVTVAEPLLLDTVTLVADGALPLKVIVQVEPVGGVTLVGLQDRLVSVGVGGNSVTVAVLETPFNVAVIVAVVLLVTAVVDTLKVPVEEFAATVAGELTVAEPLLLDTVTLVADGALPLKVIVQVDPVGGVTLVGLQDRFVRVGVTGNSVTVAVLETPFNVAVIVAVVLLVTAVVETLKVPVEEFAATAAGELTVAEPLLLDTGTLVADGALPLKVIVQVDPVGGVTLVGLQDRFVRVGVTGNSVTVAVLETPFNVAVMVAVVLLVTAVVETLKVPVEEFAATAAGELTVAEPLLLDTVTLVADGALPLKVIVQVDPVGGVTLVGLQDRFVRVGVTGNSVTVAVLETPFNVAVIVAVVLLVTAVVETLKVPVEEFAATVAGELTVAEPLLLDTVTLVADGALPLKVIVQVDPVGGVTLVGLQDRFVRVGVTGNSVTVAVLETPFNVAVIVAVVLLVTAVVETLKVPVEEFAATVAGELTVAEPLLLDTVTLVADGALPLKVIVQVDPVGGVTLVGLQDRFVRVGVTG